ncbi:hypothetical protein DM01DRAFT_1021090 [Hesseltinella vesiculosa]|uniref:Uncharacterized protein n=1 Tax=Hesseltinella vesiculosa TaxID=101127 RepID=A0A1X2GLP2_9FUNG|nr:hypothetical protein DM01DRAFT_1021090 [Hesseltinella vesiculosa]
MTLQLLHHLVHHPCQPTTTWTTPLFWINLAPFSMTPAMKSPPPMSPTISTGFFSHQQWDRIVQQVDQQDSGLIQAMTHANSQRHQVVSLACMRYFSSPQDAHSALYIPGQDFYVLRHVLKEKLGPDLQTEGLALFQNDKTTVEYARVCTRVMLAVCVLAEADSLPSCIQLPPAVKQSALALLQHAEDGQLSPERDHFAERSLLPFVHDLGVALVSQKLEECII